MKRTDPRLLLLTSTRAGHPVLEASLARELSVVDARPHDVAGVFGPGSDPVPWVGEQFAPTRSPWWPLTYLAVVARTLLTLSPQTVYARDDLAALVPALVPRRFRRWRFVYDKRGVIGEESYLRHHSAVRRFLLERVEGWVLRRADLVKTVSQEMDRHLQARFGRPADIVVANGILEESIGSSAEPSDAIRIAYVGGLDPWQCANEVARMFAAIHRASPEIELIVATRDTTAVDVFPSGSGVRVVSLSPPEVRALLERCTASVVLRHDDLVSRVASPLKVAESLAAGCGLIVTDTSWEGVDLLTRQGLAFRVELADVESVDGLRRWLVDRSASGVSAREQTRAFAREHLTLDRRQGDLDKFYFAASRSRQAP